LPKLTSSLCGFFSWVWERLVVLGEAWFSHAFHARAELELELAPVARYEVIMTRRDAKSGNRAATYSMREWLSQLGTQIRFRQDD
jgi:hypothetical protein